MTLGSMVQPSTPGRESTLRGTNGQAFEVSGRKNRVWTVQRLHAPIQTLPENLTSPRQLRLLSDLMGTTDYCRRYREGLVTARETNGRETCRSLNRELFFGLRGERTTPSWDLSRFEYLDSVSGRQIRSDGGNSSIPDTAILWPESRRRE
jgi:hypothetical protein